MTGSEQTTIRRLCVEMFADGNDGQLVEWGQPRDWQQVLDRAAAIRLLGQAPDVFEVKDRDESWHLYVVEGAL